MRILLTILEFIIILDLATTIIRYMLKNKVENIDEEVSKIDFSIDHNIVKEAYIASITKLRIINDCLVLNPCVAHPRRTINAENFAIIFILTTSIPEQGCST